MAHRMTKREWEVADDNDIAAGLAEAPTRAPGQMQTIDRGVLMAAARGAIDLNRLAREELANRGLDYLTGKWVGFVAARRLVAETAMVHGKRVAIPASDETAVDVCEVCEETPPTTMRDDFAVCAACAEGFDTDIAPTREG